MIFHILCLQILTEQVCTQVVHKPHPEPDSTVKIQNPSECPLMHFQLYNLNRYLYHRFQHLNTCPVHFFWPHCLFLFISFLSDSEGCCHAAQKLLPQHWAHGGTTPLPVRYDQTLQQQQREQTVRLEHTQTQIFIDRRTLRFTNAHVQYLTHERMQPLLYF